VLTSYFIIWKYYKIAILKDRQGNVDMDDKKSAAQWFGDIAQGSTDQCY